MLEHQRHAQVHYRPDSGVQQIAQVTLSRGARIVTDMLLPKTRTAP